MVNLKGKVHGPDVSDWEGSVEWKQVAESGAQFAVFKISEGVDRVERLATPQRVKEIRAAGLTAGAYHYLHPRPGRSGAIEARLFIERGKRLGLWQRDNQLVRDLRPVLDFEETHFPTNTRIGRYRTRLYVRQAIKEVIRLTGHAPIIYTGGPFWNQFGFKWNLKCELWLAAYDSSFSKWVPKPWWKPALWQYTDSKTVPGINSKCDYSVFLLGNSSEFRARLTF